MSNSRKTALCGVLSAFAAALLLTSRAGLTVYTSPALAGLVIGVVALEIGGKWAFLCYFSVSLLSFFFAGVEGAVMFIAFFGYYPIVTLLLERNRGRIFSRKWFRWSVKVLLFNTAVIAAYAFLSFVFGIKPEDYGKLGQYTAPILFAVGNVIFLLYDFAARGLAPVYLKRISPAVRRLFR
ncbi:MAG: hypothetical protein LBQ48_08475 [Oscillospiraceae bacterium]|jgi:hypothetical protein|nr:hypothetical protein [Oscillospiraceae bacterium]